VFIKIKWKYLSILIFTAILMFFSFVGWNYVQSNYNGKALARLIMKGFNKNRRGRMELGAVYWRPGAIIDYLTGMPAQVRIEKIKLYDARGNLVVDVPEAKGWIYLSPLQENLSLKVENIQASSGTINIKTIKSPDREGTEIGLLGLFKTVRKTKKTKDTGEKKKPDRQWFISVNNFDLENLALNVDLPALQMQVKGGKVKGGYIFYGSPSKTIPLKFHFQALPVAKEAKVALFGKEHHFEKIKFYTGFMDERAPMNIHFAVSARETTSDSPVWAFAHLGDHGIKVDAVARKAAAIASRYIPLIKLDDQENSRAVIKIRGTVAEPEVDIYGEGLYFKNPWGSPVNNLEGWLVFRKSDFGSVMKFKNISGITEGAKLEANGAWDMSTGKIFSRIKGFDLDPSSYLPPDIAGQFPNKIRGSIDIRTVFPEVEYVLFGWQLQGKGGVLAQLNTTGEFAYEDRNVNIYEATLKSDELGINVDGKISKEGKIKLQASVHGTRMGNILGRLGLSPYFYASSFKGSISGHLNDPVAQGNMTLGGIRVAGVKFPYASGFIFLNKDKLSLGGGPLAAGKGKIYTRATVTWEDGIRLWAQGKIDQVKPGSLMKNKNISGQIDGKFKIAGKPGNLNGYIHLKSKKGEAYKLEYANFDSRIKLKNNTLVIPETDFQIQNSKVVAGGKIDPEGKIDLKLHLSGLKVDQAKTPVKGILKAKINIGGTYKNPVIRGRVALEEPSLFGKKLPEDGVVVFSRINQQNVFQGNMFSLFEINGSYQGISPFKIKMHTDFEDLDPSIFLPGRLLAAYGIKGKISGKGNLKYESSQLPEANLEISKLEMEIEGKTSPYLPDKKSRKIKLSKTARLNYKNNRLKIEDFNLKGSDTDIKIGGFADSGKQYIGIDGKLDLELIPYFLTDNLISDMQGQLLTKMRINAESKGGISAEGTVYFAGNKIGFKEYEQKVTLRSGKLIFKDSKLFYDNIRVVLNEEEVIVKGVSQLDKFLTPQDIDASIKGNVSIKLLDSFMPGSFYSATGRARVDIDLEGEIKDPVVQGKVLLEEDNRLLLRSGRDLRIAKASRINFRKNRFELKNFKLFVEDGYALMNGGFTWKNGRPVNTSIDIKLRNLVERSSSYTVELMGDLQLASAGEGPLSLSGSLDVLNAKYTKDYRVNLMSKLLTPVQRTSESGTSFLEQNEWLSEMNLGLNVQLSGNVEIDNNLSQTRLEGVVQIGGNVGSPKIGGIISLVGGTFRIPMLRGSYEIKEGMIDFDKAKLVGHEKNEPYVDLVGEMVFTDRLDNEHIITLNIQGFVSQLNLRWSSSSGLNSTQVLMLLMLNRTPEEIRRGETGGLPDLGGMFEGYVPLNLQLGVTSDSVNVYVNKKFLDEHLQLKGNMEVGFMGNQKQEAFLIFRIHDQLKLQGSARRKIYEEETTSLQNENETRGRIELKYKINLKGAWKDILGY
jgi:hypothetical protein